MPLSSQLNREVQKQRIKFRSMLYGVCEQMDEKDVKCMSFLYELEFDSKEKNATDLIEALVRAKKVEDDAELLVQFQSVLTDHVKKKDLGKMVGDYLTLTSADLTQSQSAGSLVTDQEYESSSDRVYQSPKGLIGTTEGKGTVISADFSCGEDEPSSLMSETNSSGIVTGSEHFMEQAEAIAQRDSEDKDTKVGAVIVQNGKVISTGVNRMPKGCAGKFPVNRARKGRPTLDTKYPYIMHAVVLAIIEALSAGKSLQGASVYTTLFPGHVDAQMVVECGIKEVVYRDNMYPNEPYVQAANKIFIEAGVVVKSM